jgi:3-oxoacyl-[acyl-carrier-protein] synthase-3
MSNPKIEYVFRNLFKVWADFDASLDNVPVIKKINNGKFRLVDYKSWLLNHRQQVIEGGRWISLAGSSVGNEYADIRSSFLKHAATEHLDYKMLEKSYVSLGGTQQQIENHPKNIGTEILSSYMFHQAGKPNPFNLLGAMFIIEGLGQKKASQWGEKIMEQLDLAPEQVDFLTYHGENDEEHMKEFEETLSQVVGKIEGIEDEIIKTASIVAKLYILQLQEIENNPCNYV